MHNYQFFVNISLTYAEGIKEKVEFEKLNVNKSSQTPEHSFFR